MENDEILKEQLAYYSARAQEYDESAGVGGRFAGPEELDPLIALEEEEARRALWAIGPVEHTLELACGTGIWTTELARISRRITALDGSPEMLALNREKLGDAQVQYVQADLFTWTPEALYDLVFFAFWLSHVPPEALEDFLLKVYRAVRPGGRVFLVDEPAGGRLLSGEVLDGQYQTRRLYDGREFRIIKVYYRPEEIASHLERLGFEKLEVRRGEYFFHLTGRRAGVNPV
jgi:demethylmenaquinone methyltransferase/2-methoxy-6-polyprenyl-1,4-benzoquinol methylase